MLQRPMKLVLLIFWTFLFTIQHSIAVADAADGDAIFSSVSATGANHRSTITIDDNTPQQSTTYANQYARNLNIITWTSRLPTLYNKVNKRCKKKKKKHTNIEGFT